MPIQIPKVDELPKFDAPPVIETILSVQFSPLTKFSNAHAGWFWKNYLGSEWESINEVPRLEDQFERFGSDRKWGSGSGFTVKTAPTAERHQILRNDKERMIQIQDSRFVYNWKKGGGDYPSFGVLLPEFSDCLTSFQQFTKDAGNDGLQLNQWEVTYVNHLFKGKEWDTPSDWNALLPCVTMPAVGVMGQQPESANGDWHLTLGDDLGRLHVSCKHVRIGAVEGPEALALQLTARGPIDVEKGVDLETGFNIGHSSIVLSFDEMTSADAHKIWKRK